MIDFGKHSVLGVRISAVDYETAIEEITSAAEQRRAHSTTALAVHGVMTGVHDPEHLYRLNQLDLVVPDGQPVRWALRWLHGIELLNRVYGPQLMSELCHAAAERRLPVFLFGSTNEVLSALERRLKERLPHLHLAGKQASRFRTLTASEAADLTQTIQDSGAALTFVGLGCPRQEVWAYEFAPMLSMPVVAVGAAFDFHAGLKRQAPPWMQKRGLEWLFRLTEEPKRLWRRYLLLNPDFAFRILVQRLAPGRSIQQRPPANKVLYG